MVGIVAGRCFAGNAALLGCCDVIIATRDSNIGMGGPAMVEGGGLGVFSPEEIGPSDVQSRNGVIDVLVDDEAEAVAAARQLPRLLPGPRSPTWDAADPDELRDVLPEDRAPRLRHARGDATRRRHRLAARAARRLRRRDLHRAGAHRGPADRRCSRATRRISAARSTPTPPTRRRGSCSCATRTGCRSSRWSTRPGSWSARRSRRAPRSGTSAGCSSPRRTCACRSSRSCCARATGSARWR